jgi:membrane-associated protease RseP (regulator of RpoE activity)
MWSCLLLAAVHTLTAPPQPPLAPPSPAELTVEQEKKIAQLITQLGDADWQARDRASAELTQIGKPALPQLVKALEHKDAEIRERAQRIIHTLTAPPQPPPAPPQPAINLGNPQQLGVAVRGVLGQIVEVLNGRNAEIENVLNEAMGGARREPLPAPPAITDSPAADFIEKFGARLGESGDGLRVTDVRDKSPASEIGLKVGDIIVKANGKPLTKSEEARAVFEKFDKDSVLELEITRREETVRLKLPAPEK